ncbi:hypothetical protein NL676_001986 [Syzygium grande]|nr:hypothetical protein NL676_001986 [Syzygium grande]
MPGRSPKNVQRATSAGRRAPPTHPPKIPPPSGPHHAAASQRRPRPDRSIIDLSSSTVGPQIFLHRPAGVGL